MPIEVKMAKLSPTMESGQLVRWLVKVGDKVKEGDTLAEIQTDKATMPMESFEEGIVAHIDVSEGEEVALGQRMLVLAKKNEDAKAVGASFAGAGKSSGAAAAPASAPSNGQSQVAEPAGVVAVTAVAAVPATGRVKSTPLARKIAAAAGTDVRLVTPTGPGGRVVKRDVESFLAGGGAASASAAAPAPVTAPAVRAAAPVAAAAGTSERVPLSRIRATIAKRMSEAKRLAPDIHLTVDVRLDEVVRLREILNQQLAAEKIKLSIGDFVTKAVAMALRNNPAMNAHFLDDAIVRYTDVNVGIAVALDQGLIVPVLHQVDRLGLKEIRQGTEALAKAARSGTLKPDQLDGGTFTISNLGMYGIKIFDAILNLPQVGILAVGAAEQRPVVVQGALAVGWVLSATLTADHRALDGANAALYLKSFKAFLEEPASMLL